MNNLCLAGHITQEPEKSISTNGTKVAKFKIAVDKFSKENDESTYDVFEVVLFRDLADVDLKVGQFVGVSGKLLANNYQKDSKSYFNCSIVGNNITFLGK